MIRGEEKSFFFRFLNRIEAIGNSLPNPATIFLILSTILIIVSAVLDYFNVYVEFQTVSPHAGTQTVRVVAVSLLTGKALVHILTHFISNFMGFAPLGVVLVAMLGVGVAEATGLIQATVKKTILSAPRFIITFAVVFIGIMSNLASDVGYVILIPMGAIIFLGIGRHPVAGMAAAFAGVSGGYSANLLFGPVDAMLGGLSTEASKLISPVEVGATANWFFMIASTFLIALVGTWVTDHIIEPRLGKYQISAEEGGENEEADYQLSSREVKALGLALLTFLVYIGLIAWAALPSNGILRDPVTHSLTSSKSPLIQSIVVIMALGFLLPGLVYGLATNAIKSDHDIIHIFEKSMRNMGGYIVLALFASQFIMLFTYSQVGTILAVKGADFLRNTHMTGLTVIQLFILISAFINLFMGSAGAKWAILAPIFVPMLMQLGYHPAFVQVAYRIGDSSTNIINPLLSYIPIIITFVRHYNPNAGIGTIISLMFPYSLFFLVSWSVLLIGWFYLGLPLGPGVYPMLN